MKKSKIIIICISILILAGVAVWMIFKSEPTTSPEAATVKTAALVDVKAVQKGDYRPIFVSTGTVKPVENLILSPLVNGQITWRSEDFVPGGFVSKGEVLLKIDPADYLNNLELRKSELLQAQTDLSMEMGRQKTAIQDLELAGIDSLSQEERQLVLRQPQLEAVKSRIQAARAAVNQARTNFERTTIEAPFDAHVINQEVTLGSQVAPGDNLGRLVGLNSYWVSLAVPVSKLPWLEFKQSAEAKKPSVKIHASSWPQDIFRWGYLEKRIGALDDETRLARVLVRVPDPLAQNKENEDLPQLLVGAFVEAHIQAEEIEDVVRIQRDFLRRNNAVWVMSNGKLEIRKVEVILADYQYAYIGSGLKDEELVVTTNLSTVAEGIPLRTKTETAVPTEENKENKQ